MYRILICHTICLIASVLVVHFCVNKHINYPLQNNTDSEYPFMILDKETMVGIDDVETGTAAEPVSKSYYSLNGMKLEAPCKGITIVKTIMSDGTVKTEKIFTK